MNDMADWEAFKVNLNRYLLQFSIKKKSFSNEKSSLSKKKNVHFHLQKENSKQYNSPADEMRHFHIFVDHKNKITEHNLRHENGLASFRMGLNEYSDLSHEEFTARMNTYRFNKE